MTISVLRIRAVANGEEAEILLEIREGEQSQQIKGTILAEMLAELSLPPRVEAPLPLERDRCDDLLFRMKKTAAIRQGLSFLGFAQNTKRALTGKLVRKGYPKDIAAEAVDYLAEKGLIDENTEAEFLAETLSSRKLYGKNRIKKELYAKGFAPDVIADVLAAREIDDAGVCAERIRLMGGASVFADRAQKAKSVAALSRYGFTYDDIRTALLLLKKENN